MANIITNSFKVDGTHFLSPTTKLKIKDVGIKAERIVNPAYTPDIVIDLLAKYGRNDFIISPCPDFICAKSFKTMSDKKETRKRTIIKRKVFIYKNKTLIIFILI